MADYILTISMDEETVEQLEQRQMHLFAFKAVKGAPAGGAQPLVWLRTDTYSMETEISWNRTFEAYSSLSEIVDHAHITPSPSYPATLGDIFTITGEHGTGDVTQGGDPQAITIRSEAVGQFACGISQESDEGGIAPLCAFPINLGHTVLFTPVEKVLVMFASDALDGGTVILRAFSPGVLVDLTDESMRTVSYNIHTGWGCGGATFCRTVDRDQDLAELLIESSDKLELARAAG